MQPESELCLASPAPHQPGFKRAWVAQNIAFEFLELGIEDETLDARSQAFISRLRALPLDEGQDRFAEL